MAPWDDSWQAAPGQASINGTYRDEWGQSSYVLKQEGSKVIFTDGDGEPSEATLDSAGLKWYNLTGTIEKGAIVWNNGSKWFLDEQAAPAVSAPHQEPDDEEENPWGNPGGEASIDGSWKDPWRNDEITVLKQEGTRLLASSPDGSWNDEGTINGNVIEIFGQMAWLQDGKVIWKSGNEWPRAGGEASPAPAAVQERAQEADTLTGTWEDSWNPSSVFKLTHNGKELTASGVDGSWPEQGTVEGTTVRVWGLEGEWKGSEIHWSSGASWKMSTGNAAAEAAEAADIPASAWDMYNTVGSAAPWGVAADSAGGGAMEPVAEATRRKRWQDFDYYQQYNKSANILPGKSEEELAADDNNLFNQAGGPNEAEGIDFELYDKVTCKITGTKAENIPELTTFSALFEQFSDHLPPVLVENIQRCGFKRPTPVQKFSIPAALTGRDIMCCAQTGSGKTAAFLIPILASMIKHSKATGALTEPFEGPCKPDTVVLSPTRELCLQIYDHATKFCHRTPHRCVRVYGQETVKVQIEQLAKGGDLCIATPGRMWDFVTSGIINLEETNCLVLDEADRMMDIGMEAFIRDIVEKNGMPSKEDRQTLMFSATFPESCQTLAQDYLYDHLFIGVGSVGGAVCTVKQTLMKVQYDQKFEALIDFLDPWLNNKDDQDRLLLFTNSKVNAKGLDEKLYERNIDTGALHGDLTQLERETNLTRFRSGEIDVLVATDLASRGLDIRGVSHVVNYDLPHEPEVYVQRIGRTGRIGNRGEAISFVAVDAANRPYDNEVMLKALPTIMQDVHTGCHNDIPAWFTEISDELQSKSWVTGGRTSWKDNKEDMRKWEEKEPAEAWSSWQQ